MNDYLPPQIEVMHAGRTNKFATAPGSTMLDQIAGIPVADLVAAYGSPLFVFDEDRLRRRVQRLAEDLRGISRQAQLAWSYKTNYLDGICALMHQEGSLAEVVSEMEYDKARQLGVAGRDIVFNGPHKTRSALRRAIAEGALIHIDHDDEIEALERIAEERGEVLEVGMRLSCDVGITPQWSRFGFNLDDGTALRTAAAIARRGKLRLVSLHCHIGTYILDPAAHGRLLDRLIDTAAELERDFGWTITTLDLGGGLPSRNRLKGSYLAPDVAVPPVEDYLAAIHRVWSHRFPNGHGPRLLLEPGRHLIDDVGYLISSVVGAKRLPDGRQSYVLDAGVNLLYTATWYQMQVRPHRHLAGIPQPSVLYGPLCMNIDVVREHIDLPPVPTGTHLTLHPVGAYTITQSMQFIEYRPAVVLITAEREVHVLRAREDLAAIRRDESLPAHLQIDHDTIALAQQRTD